MEMKLPVKMGMETMSDYGNGMGMRKKSWEWEGMGIKMLIPHTSDANVNLTLGELSAKYHRHSMSSRVCETVRCPSLCLC